jgi:RHS repeat-associated protein
VVAYTHGGGIDQPLGIIRVGMLQQPDPGVLFPHANWRGSFEGGSHVDGTTCWAGPGCILPWPSRGTTADGQLAHPVALLSWFGNLVVGKTDGSGLQYLRNRYYDPRTGRFTQEDPIGLAGGLNLYGFAQGDPVNFGDPFGLCPPEDENYSDCPPGTSEWYANRIATGEGNRLVNEVGGALATCAESISCMTALIPGTVIGAAAGRVAQALGVAGKAAGNVSVAVGSELEAQIAGKLWTGAGASPIRTARGAGEIVGSKSADGLRIFRQAVEKGAGHFSAGERVANLVNKITGGNTHLVIKVFMWW